MLLKKYRIVLAFLAICTSLTLTGCGTLEGLQRDWKELSNHGNSSEQAISTKDTSIRHCKQQGRDQQSYRDCLERQVQSSLSKDDIFQLVHNVPAFKECVPIYRNPQAERWQYSACQAREFSKKEATRLIATDQRKQQQRMPKKQTRGRGYARNSTQTIQQP